MDDLLLWLHQRGLYKTGDCVCHPPEANRHSDDELGMGEAVEATLHAVGVDPDEAASILFASASEQSDD